MNHYARGLIVMMCVAFCPRSAAQGLVSLNVERITSDMVRFSWSDAGFRLEQTSDIATNATWSFVSGAPVIENGLSRLSLKADTRQQFFQRLRLRAGRRDGL
jgi:hypothetical protein